MRFKLVVFALLPVSTITHAQITPLKRPLGKATRVDSAAVLKPITVPAPPAASFEIDTSSMLLPANFGDGEVTELFRTLKAEPKGEYESTLEYQKRVATSTQDHFYAVSLIATDNSPCNVGATFSYDAENETANATIGTPEIMLQKDSGEYAGTVHVLTLRCHWKRSTYQASNAFGAATTVLRDEGESVSVTSDSLLDTRIGLSRIRFSLPRGEAPAVKPMLKLFAVFNAKSSARVPAISKGAYAQTPTRDLPHAINIDQSVIWAGNISLWVVDGRNGRVLLKQSLCHPYNPPGTSSIRYSCN